MSAQLSPSWSLAGVFHARRPHAEAQRNTGAGDAPQAPGLVEAAGIWAVLLALTAAVFVTYSRVPVSDLYNVDESGIAGGASRALVHLNFPVAIFAIPLAALAVARLFALPGALSRAGRWTVGIAGTFAVTLALVTGVPGVVDQGDLTATPANIVPALGVLLALALNVFAVWRTGFGRPRPRGMLDALTLVVAGILFLPALPWLLADFGVYIADIPFIGSWSMSKEMLPGETLPAIHLGHHHGLDGVMFALAGLLLLRPLLQMGASRLRGPLAVFLSLMVVYGIANAVQDFWGEQIVKRGWTDTHIPGVLRPDFSIAWGLILVATAVVAAVVLRVSHGHVERSLA